MTDTLLTSLRNHMLDESEVLAGLLRKCLLLGAETGSNSLRHWARKELNGYDNADELPGYRKLPTPALSADTMSGTTWAKNMTYSVLQMPAKARQHVESELLLHQPVEELEQLSTQKSLSFTSMKLTYAQQLWNQELGPFEEVMNLRLTVSGSVFAGVLGQVRTQLIDLVADLTVGTPLTELPKKELVDAAVSTHIGTQYNTTLQSPSGPTAIGNGAIARSEGLSVDDAIKLLDAVRDASGNVTNTSLRAELLEAVADLHRELKSATPDTGEVIKKTGRLKTIAAGIGNITLSAAVSGAAEALTGLAISGTFG